LFSRSPTVDEVLVVNDGEEILEVKLAYYQKMYQDNFLKHGWMELIYATTRQDKLKKRSPDGSAGCYKATF
jgi:hypothetical protein